MKSRKLATYMAIGLGLLTATAAQAVQTKMTITGSVIEVSGSVNSTDQGLNSAWGSALYPNQINDRITAATGNGTPISIELQFDSDIFSYKSYSTSDATYQNHFKKQPNSGQVTAAVTYNQVTRRITSDYTWEFKDENLTFVNGQNVVSTPTQNTADKLTIVVDQTGANGNSVENLTMLLSFADGSTPVLQNLTMAKAGTFNPIATGNIVTRFAYQAGKHNNGAWDYNSILYFAPNSLSIAPVPEPETWAMMVAGLGLVGFAAKRRSR